MAWRRVTSPHLLVNVREGQRVAVRSVRGLTISSEVEVRIGFGAPPPSQSSPLTIDTTSFADVAGGGTANQQIQVSNGVGEVVMFPDPLDAADEHWPNSLFVTPDDQILLGTVEV